MESRFLRMTLKEGQYCLMDEVEILRNRAKAHDPVKWLQQLAENPTDSTEALTPTSSEEKAQKNFGSVNV